MMGGVMSNAIGGLGPNPLHVCLIPASVPVSHTMLEYKQYLPACLEALVMVLID